MTGDLRSDRGATAILVALVMVLLMGIAAVAIDLGFGFNERRQSQTAADMAVMAGATEVVLGGTQEQVVNQILAFAESNLNIEYSSADWRSLWMNCTDPDRLGFDVGTGTPVDFQPMPAPSTWGAGDLECISSVASYLRVRIPDQIVETTFAKVMGFDEVITSAAAVARIDAGGALGSIVPFGIPAGTPSGEICASTGPGGHVEPPCDSNERGSFNEIQSQFFGDYWGTPSCKNPSADNTVPRNVALGLDHAVSTWPAAMAAIENVSLGDPYPGNKNDVLGYEGRGLDECKIEGGSAAPAHAGDATPPNMLLMQSGFSGKQVFEGMVSGTFLGEEARLRRYADAAATRVVDSKKIEYEVDNKGLWDYLNHTNGVAGLPECNGSTYTTGLTVDQKVERMHDCLAGYPSHETQDLFSLGIEDSPRLVWAPEFWHGESGSESWQPIYQFRLIFLAGLYFDGVDEPFYPDAATTGVVCEPQGSGCKNSELRLVQMTSFLLPTESVPEQAKPPIPGEDTAFNTSLLR